MKPDFKFYFADEPQFASLVGRAWLANALRAYRKHAARYNLRRLGLHSYSVEHGAAVAIIAMDA